MTYQEQVEGGKTQPPTVECKNGSSVGICMRCMHVFFARLGADLCTRSALIDKNFCVGAQEEVY